MLIAEGLNKFAVRRWLVYFHIKNELMNVHRQNGDSACCGLCEASLSIVASYYCTPLFLYTNHVWWVKLQIIGVCHCGHANCTDDFGSGR